LNYDLSWNLACSAPGKMCTRSYSRVSTKVVSGAPLWAECQQWGCGAGAPGTQRRLKDAPVGPGRLAKSQGSSGGGLPSQEHASKPQGAQGCTARARGTWGKAREPSLASHRHVQGHGRTSSTENDAMSGDSISPNSRAHRGGASPSRGRGAGPHARRAELRGMRGKWRGLLQRFRRLGESKRVRPLISLPTCRREKRAVPGCSTREPQRWHSTAFRFRPSADVSLFSSSTSSISEEEPQPPRPRPRTRGLCLLRSWLRRRSSAGAGLERTSARFCASAVSPLCLPGLCCASALIRCLTWVAGCRFGFVTGTLPGPSDKSFLCISTWSQGFPWY
jgi:hypothetical protein